METKNNLPKYWCVYSGHGSLNRFRSTVIKYLNEKHGTDYSGANYMYYGYDGNVYGANYFNSPEHFHNKTTVLTLEQFIEMSKPIEEWTPKRGELVEVKSYEGEDWCRNVYLTTIEGTYNPFICVYSGHDEEFKRGNKFNISSYRFMRKIEAPTHIELTLEDIADKFGVSVFQLRIKEA